MKLITYKHTFFIALILSLCSCEDFFETTIEIDPPEYEEQLVVQGFGSTSTDVVNVLVSKTSGILETVDEDELIINDAIVTLIHQGVSYELEVATPAQNEGKPYNFILEEGILDLKPGERYVLEVEADGYDKAIGTCTVPEIVLPTDFVFRADGPSMLGDEYSEVNMLVSDPVDVENYYEFYLSLGDVFNNETYFSYLNTDSFDPVIEVSFYSLLLKDETFDGEDKAVELLMDKFYFDNEPDIQDRLYISWRTVSEDHHTYNKSFDQHLESVDNPFATPVQVYSNIENGLGIFSIYNEEVIKIN